MGDIFGDGNADEKPVHTVIVTSFYMSKNEVTMGQFRRRMVVAAMIAVIIASLFELWGGLLDGTMIGNTLNDVLEAAFYIFLPKIVYAIIIPIFVTVFGWFGISPKQMM